MKALLFILLSSVAFGQASNYALVNADGTVIEVFVATPDVASTYPDNAKQAFPDAVRCVPALGAGIGWSYNSLTGAFTPPLAEVSMNVASTPPILYSSNPAPVIALSTANVVTTNNVAITTNNVSITTNNTTP